MRVIIECLLWTILLGIILAAYYIIIFMLPYLNRSTNPLRPVVTETSRFEPEVDGSAKIKCSVCGISQVVGKVDGIYEGRTCEQLELDGAAGLFNLDQCNTFSRSIGRICNCLSIPSLKLCEDDNMDDMQDVLKLDPSFYMIELLKPNPQTNNNNDVLTDYINFLETEVLPNAQGELVLWDSNRIAQWPNESPDWEQAIITKFASGYLFQKHVMENPILRSEWETREAHWKTPYVWFGQSTSSGQEINTMDDNRVKFLHAMQFKKPNGQSLVKGFDSQVKTIKSDKDVMSHGEWSVALTCIGYDANYEEIRLESAPSLEAYSDLVTEPIWEIASRDREKGLTDETFTAVMM